MIPNALLSVESPLLTILILFAFPLSELGPPTAEHGVTSGLLGPSSAEAFGLFGDDGGNRNGNDRWRSSSGRVVVQDPMEAAHVTRQVSV